MSISSEKDSNLSKKERLQNDAKKKIKKSFDLSSFKKKKGLSDTSIEFKEQEYLPVSEALRDIVSLPGIPLGHITLLRGHSDTGKTTALLEAAISAQNNGILPVLIITEMKWNGIRYGWELYLY